MLHRCATLLEMIHRFAKRFYATTIDERRKLIDELVGASSTVPPSELLPLTLSEAEVKHKTENYIGCLPYPVGLCGPLIVNETPFHVPLATLEGALVASYKRGCKIINASGGAQAICHNDFITRATLFSCKSLTHAASLVSWIRQHLPELTEYMYTFTVFEELISIVRLFGTPVN